MPPRGHRTTGKQAPRSAKAVKHEKNAADQHRGSLSCMLMAMNRATQQKVEGAEEAQRTYKSLKTLDERKEFLAKFLESSKERGGKKWAFATSFGHKCVSQVLGVK